MEVTEVKTETPEPLGDDYPCLMNTAEDARQFWDEIVNVVNADSRSQATFLDAQKMAAQHSLPAVTEQLNTFIGELEKIRTVGPQFISKFVLMFNGFVNLWRKESDLSPLVNIDPELQVSETEEGMSLSPVDKRVRLEAQLFKRLPPLKGDYNFRNSGNLHKLLPRDGTREPVSHQQSTSGTAQRLNRGEPVKRNHDGQLVSTTAPPQRILKPKMDSAPTVHNQSYRPSIVEKPIAQKPSPKIPVPVTAHSALPVNGTPLFLRLPNGQFAPVDPNSMTSPFTSTQASASSGVNVVPKFMPSGTTKMADSGIVYRPLLSQALQTKFDSNARLIMPKTNTWSVTSGPPVDTRCSASPARKLARIAPAPSRDSDSYPVPVSMQRNESESQIYEADIAICRPFQEPYFQTTVTVDKSNGQGCISDTNKNCNGGKISLRGICNLGNFDNVKIEDLVLRFDEGSTHSNVKLNIKFKKV